ncbi:MAG: YmdB family metallophosphoesterase [Alphaproteobacteria bacterium]|nr:YmdB family metallophosphoesterase [Alphaproteobacteria bacterium]
MKIVYIGDVVARAGREAVYNNISRLREIYKFDILIVNTDNAAHGFGVTPGICRDMLEKGVGAIVTGDHVWNQREIIPFLDECKKIVRPLNYPDKLAGCGAREIELHNGKKILVAEVVGRLFMEAVDCPAQAMDNLLKNYNLGRNIDAIFVDIHAEATAEKIAFGHYLDGRVSAVIGSHTHVPTSDMMILPKGTAYQTDAGMCGDYSGVIGFETEAPIDRLCRRYTGSKLSPLKGSGTLFGTFIETDDKSGLAIKIEQICIRPENHQ